MKKILSLLFLACVFLACGNKQKQEQTASQPEVVVFTVDNLIPVAEENKDQEVLVSGIVTHVCKHSGQKCFIVGDDDNFSLRIEAKGDIGSFDQELIGSTIRVKGILKEQLRLTAEELDEKEKETLAKKESGEDEETCNTELNSIAGWRKWMQDNNKNYYAIYYVEGKTYEVLE